MTTRKLWLKTLFWFDLLVYRLALPSLTRLITMNSSNAHIFKLYLDEWMRRNAQPPGRGKR